MQDTQPKSYIVAHDRRSGRPDGQPYALYSKLAQQDEKIRENQLTGADLRWVQIGDLADCEPIPEKTLVQFQFCRAWFGDQTVLRENQAGPVVCPAGPQMIIENINVVPASEWEKLAAIKPNGFINIKNITFRVTAGCRELRVSFTDQITFEAADISPRPLLFKPEHEFELQGAARPAVLARQSILA